MIEASPAAARRVADGEKRTERMGLRSEGRECRRRRVVLEKTKRDPDWWPEAVKVASVDCEEKSQLLVREICEITYHIYTHPKTAFCLKLMYLRSICSS
jgi:hypothetical protein